LNANKLSLNIEKTAIQNI